MLKRKSWRCSVGFLVALASSAIALRSVADDKPDAAADAKKTAFVRVLRDAKESPTALETAIVRYVSGHGDSEVVVDLVAAVHVGDKEYYEALNKRFEGYDVVLYELVAPENARVPKAGEGKSKSMLSSFQRGLKDILKLEFQLDQVDYKAKNFVHADMSPTEFDKAMGDRGESFWTMFYRMMMYSMARQANAQGKGASDFDLLMALLDRNRSAALKRIMAEQMAELDGMAVAIDGPKGSALLTGRNQKALEVLKKEIAAGKKRIAIFYGAAHMPDFESRLGADFKLKPTQTEWLKAWSLADPPKKAAPAAKKAAA